MPIVKNPDSNHQRRMMGKDPAQLAAPLASAPGAEATLYALLSVLARTAGDAPALCAPGRAPLSYRRLLARVDDLAAALSARGVGRQDRLALILPDGPELAVAFLGISKTATCAIQSPAPGAREHSAALSRLRSSGVVLPTGSAAAARQAARALGLPIFELSLDPTDEAGAISLLAGLPGERPCSPAPPAPSDVMLLLPTSGTTACPRLVPLSHGNVYAAATAMAKVLALGPADRCLNIMPLFHIHGLSTITASIAAGASVFLSPGFEPQHFFAWVSECRPTWTTASPTIYRAIRDLIPGEAVSQAAGSFRFLRSASSPMPPQLLTELEQLFQAPFLEAYGMTEAAPLIANSPLPPGERKLGSVGRAAGTELAIADEQGRFLGPREVGEILVRGPNVLPAYVEDPTTNAAAFLQGYLRTGDLGYLDEDGFLFITGRLKEIINRGGEKVSPHEVEAELLEHVAVAEAVSFPIPHPRLGEEVAAAVVVRSGQSVSERVLQHYLARRLVDFKVPRRIVFVKELQRGHTGKLQRSSLARQLGLHDASSGINRVTADRPRTPTEEILIDVWSKLLEIAPHWIGIHDNLFQLGADSLLALRAISKVAKVLKITLRVADLFLNPTVSEQAHRIEDTHRSRQGGVAIRSQIGTPPSDSLLSFAEEALWFLAQLEPANAAYNVYRGALLRGPIQPELLERAIQVLVARHGTLRSAYKTDSGRPYREVTDQVCVPLPRVDLRALPLPERLAEAVRLAQAEAQRPFDLARAPLLRMSIFWLAPHESLLVLTAHHIVVDLWSLGVFFTELDAVYRALLGGCTTALPPLHVTYPDFAAWQRSQQALFDQQSAYWKKQLFGLPPPLFGNPAALAGEVAPSAGRRVFFEIPQRLSEAVKALGHQQEATLFMMLLAAMKVLLWRLTGRQDVVVGTPIAGRLAELEGLVGIFSNTLVLRTNLAGSVTFLDVLARVRETALSAYMHQELPFERLVHAVAASGSRERADLFQVNFRVQRDAAPPHLGPSTALRFIKLDSERAKFPLAVELADADDGLRGFVEYQRALFSPAEIDQLVGYFLQILKQVAERPGAPLLDICAGIGQAVDSQASTPQQEPAAGQQGGMVRRLREVRRMAVEVGPSDGERGDDQVR